MENQPTNPVISEQPIFTMVQTPLLEVRLDALKKESPVYDASGKIQRVLDIEKTGIKSVYKVTFSDGSQMDCSEDHELVYTIGNVKHTKSVGEFLVNKGLLQQQANFALCKPVERMEKKLFDIPVDIMGILLRSSTKMVYTDNEIILIISNKDLEKLTNTFDDISCTYFGGDAKHTTITSIKLITALKEYSVAKHPQYRVIPNLYMRGSVEQRKELLNSMKYSSSYVHSLYKPMANSIQALAEGLGYAVSVKRVLADGYTYSILRLSEQPRKIIDISYAYRADMLRITTSGFSGKYLTNNHIT